LKFHGSLENRLFSETEAEYVCDWKPLPGPQTEAYNSKADILGYGGAAGGGKSDLILGLASTTHRKSVIFRRIFPNLRALIERSREILNPENVEHGKDSFNESLHRWTLGNGKMIEFEACQFEKDKEKQRGRPRDFYAFDEATEFTKSQFMFIVAWLRSTRKNQRCRVVLTFNPPSDESGSWMLEYFMPWIAYLFPDKFSYPNPAAPGELRWFATVDGEEVEVESGEPFEHGDEVIRPLSRTFIPAQLSDNPHLDNTNYRAILQSMPEPFRSQLLHGDWTAVADGDPWQLIPTAWIDAAMKRWEKPSGIMDALGVDVARGGKDQTVLTPRYGRVIDEQQIFPGKLTPDGSSVAILVESVVKPETIIGLDIIGVGTSPFDILVGNGFNVIPLNGVAKAIREECGKEVQVTDKSGRLRMRNLRAAMFWNLREMLEDNEIDLPPDRNLRSQLISIRWKITPSGVLIESKDDIIKRKGESPDEADSCAYAAWVTPPPPRIGLSEALFQFH
jgi:hypothetical protein